MGRMAAQADAGGWLRSAAFIGPALLALLVGGSCGLSAHAQDLNNSSGPLPGFAATVTTLASVAVAIVITGIAVTVAAVRRKWWRSALSTVIAAVVLPAGVMAGLALGRSGALPTPPPTATPALPTAGRVSLNLDPPFPTTLEGPGQCTFSGGNAFIGADNASHDWQIQWGGGDVIFRPRVHLENTNGSLAVKVVQVALEQAMYSEATYSNDHLQASDTATTTTDGRSGEVRLVLVREPPLDGKPTPVDTWPATMSAALTWSCD